VCPRRRAETSTRAASVAGKRRVHEVARRPNLGARLVSMSSSAGDAEMLGFAPLYGGNPRGIGAPGEGTPLVEDAIALESARSSIDRRGSPRRRDRCPRRTVGPGLSLKTRRRREAERRRHQVHLADDRVLDGRPHPAMPSCASVNNSEIVSTGAAGVPCDAGASPPRRDRAVRSTRRPAESSWMRLARRSAAVGGPSMPVIATECIPLGVGPDAQGDHRSGTPRTDTRHVAPRQASAFPARPGIRPFAANSRIVGVRNCSPASYCERSIVAAAAVRLRRSSAARTAIAP